ncbi:MAG: hypothetical protein R6U98_23085, partial [Pirellulaceae bacterium]
QVGHLALPHASSKPKDLEIDPRAVDYHTVRGEPKGQKPLPECLTNGHEQIPSPRKIREMVWASDKMTCHIAPAKRRNQLGAPPAK